MVGLHISKERKLKMDLRDIDQWVNIGGSKNLLALTANKKRKVVVDYNVNGDAVLSIQRGGSKPEFLIRVSGQGRFSFMVSGQVKLVSDNVQTFVYSKEMEKTSYTPEDATSFATIMNRRPRNLDMEKIEAKMIQNQNRRLAAMQAHMELLAREANDATTKVSSGTGATSGGEDEARKNAEAGAEAAQPAPGSEAQAEIETEDVPVSDGAHEKPVVSTDG